MDGIGLFHIDSFHTSPKFATARLLLLRMGPDQLGGGINGQNNVEPQNFAHENGH